MDSAIHFDGHIFDQTVEAHASLTVLEDIDLYFSNANDCL